MTMEKYEEWISIKPFVEPDEQPKQKQDRNGYDAQERKVHTCPCPCSSDSHCQNKQRTRTGEDTQTTAVYYTSARLTITCSTEEA